MDNTKIRNYLMSMDTEQNRHIMKRNWHLEEVTPPQKKQPMNNLSFLGFQKPLSLRADQS